VACSPFLDEIPPGSVRLTLAPCGLSRTRAHPPALDLLTGTVRQCGVANRAGASVSWPQRGGARAGWPVQFYEEGGFAYRSNFNLLFLIINVAIGVVFSIIPGWIQSHSKRPLLKKSVCAIMPSLCDISSASPIIMTMTIIPVSLGEALLVKK